MSEWGERIDSQHLGDIEYILLFHVGRKNAISRKKLLRSVAATTDPLTDRQLRLAISQMRNEGHLICSRGGHGGGYWMAENLGELLEFIERELKSRAYDMLRTAKKMEASGMHKLTQQIGLILGDET